MKLSYAIIFSLLGHGILFMSWPDAVNFAVSSTHASFQVTLLQQQTEKKPRQKNKNTQAKIKSSENQQKPALLQKIISSSLRKKQTVETIKQPDFDSKAYVISRINYEIKNHFRYPILARRNGWQGKVILGLSVNSQGNIENAHIKVGSGYRILDKSALNALNKVKRIPDVQKWSYPNHHELVIPVIYKLQKG